MLENHDLNPPVDKPIRTTFLQKLFMNPFPAYCSSVKSYNSFVYVTKSAGNECEAKC